MPTSGALYPLRTLIPWPQPSQTHQEYFMSSIGKHVVAQYARLSPPDWRQLLSPMSPPGHPVLLWNLWPLNSQVQFPKWEHPDLFLYVPTTPQRRVFVSGTPIYNASLYPGVFPLFSPHGCSLQSVGRDPRVGRRACEEAGTCKEHCPVSYPGHE